MNDHFYIEPDQLGTELETECRLSGRLPAIHTDHIYDPGGLQLLMDRGFVCLARELYSTGEMDISAFPVKSIIIVGGEDVPGGYFGNDVWWSPEHSENGIYIAGETAGGEVSFDGSSYHEDNLSKEYKRMICDLAPNLIKIRGDWRDIIPHTF